MKTPRVGREAVQLLRPELPWLLLAFGCMAVLVAATTVAAELIGPVMHALVLGGVPESWLGRVFSPELLRHSAWLLPGLLVALGVVKGVAYFGQFHLMGMSGQRVASRLRRRVLAALVQAGPSYLLRQRTGDLLSRLSGDVSAVEMAVTYALAAYVRDTATTLALLGLCLWLDWRLSLIAFGLLPLTAWPLVRVTRMLRTISRRAQTSQGDLGHHLAEGLQGLRTIQVDGLEAREQERFRGESRKMLRDLERGVRLRSLSSPLMEIVAVAGLSLMLWLASAEVARGTISPDHLVSFLASALLLAQPVKSLGRVGQFAVTGQAALERLVEAEEGALASLAAPSAPGTQRAPGAPQLIEFRDVWFRYPARAGSSALDGEPAWALSGFNLTLTRGEHLGLVGESGAGKTTAVALLLGLYRPERGAICVDGVDLATLPLGARREPPRLGRAGAAASESLDRREHRPRLAQDGCLAARRGGEAGGGPRFHRAGGRLRSAGRRARRPFLGRRAAAVVPRPRLLPGCAGAAPGRAHQPT